MRSIVTRQLFSWNLALVLLIGANSAYFSKKGQDEPLRLKTDLVLVTAAVTDSRGRAVKGLSMRDFTLYEDGVPQKISHFEAADRPFSLMLLLDLSGSASNDLSLIKRAARNFLIALRKDDTVGLIVFSGQAEMPADLTRGRSTVEAAIERLESPPGSETHRFTVSTGTSFYDALDLAVEESGLKRAEGRKAIICMSDGVDSTSRMRYAEVAKLVEESGASVYFLELDTEESTLEGVLKNRTDPGFIGFSRSQIDRYYDEFAADSLERHRPREALTLETRKQINEGLYKIARKQTRELSERTGGRLYRVKSLFDLAGVYSQVADDLRTQYDIGYYSTNKSRDGSWRAIQVRVDRQGSNVRARSGYWAPDK